MEKCKKMITINIGTMVNLGERDGVVVGMEHMERLLG